MELTPKRMESTPLGQTVGWAEIVSFGNAHAFFQQSVLTMEDLGTLGGGDSEAQDINDLFQIAGFSQTAATEIRAFIKDGTQAMQDLGTLGGNNSRAFAINNNEQIVGDSEISPGIVRAMLYESNQMYDLNEMISSDSGWTLIEAHDINDQGQIVGWGIVNGATHAFLLHPASLPPKSRIQIDLDTNKPGIQSEMSISSSAGSLMAQVVLEGVTDVSQFDITFSFPSGDTIISVSSVGWQSGELFGTDPIVDPPSVTAGTGSYGEAHSAGQGVPAFNATLFKFPIELIDEGQAVFSITTLGLWDHNSNAINPDFIRSATLNVTRGALVQPTGTPTSTPTPTITNTPTPTPTITQTPMPTPFETLDLDTMCSPNPSILRKWIVFNQNDYDVLFDWEVVGTSQTGSETVPAAGSSPGEVMFTTIPEGTNTVQVFVQSNLQDVLVSDASPCPCLPPDTPDGILPDGFVEGVDPDNGELNVPLATDTIVIQYGQPMDFSGGSR